MMSQPSQGSASLRLSGRGVTAVLGPTNTGKTHLAIDRMLASKSGMIGLPLRLLAREVYSRVVEKAGEDAVALITGEEKILPSDARYFVCTVEAMPRDISVDFLAVDEVQLAADLDRGHVFTDRILNHRGVSETLLLGSQTIRPLIEELLPGANIVTRPRFSTLAYAGDKKITRLPRRSAIVAFSSSEVYAIAELVRRHRGGAAVVMGALSPRTRNAQVELYQSGDVDFLIATDAIGMGLNLDVKHVAFAADRKFDGFQYRKLTAAELSQIAGRAGRFKTDGTFGVTGQLEPFEQDIIERIESHEFPPIEVLQWRNTKLDFATSQTLCASLDETPDRIGLTRSVLSSDRLALDAAIRNPDISPTLTDTDAVERLWSVCAVPDYRKIAPANHAELVISIYRHLTEDGLIPEDWFGQQIGFSDRVDGDIDTLSNRIAHIRTWTFVANRSDWLKDPDYWRETTRAVEDRLSDALHERLTQRFVDRRTSVLMRRLQETEHLEAKVNPDGKLYVEDHFVGTLSGLCFTPDGATGNEQARAAKAASQRVLASTLNERAEALTALADSEFQLEINGEITWAGAPVGRLECSDDLLVPRVQIIADDQLSGPPRDKALERLQKWMETQTRTQIKPLFDLREATDLEGMASGIAFRLVENQGVLVRAEVADDVKSIDQPVRGKMRTLGVRFGAYHLFLPALLKPAPRRLLAQLFALAAGSSTDRLSEVLALSASGRTSVPVNTDLSQDDYRSVGYRVCGRMAVRVDILERLADLIRPLIAWRDNGSTPRPEGAEPGNAFMATVVMTSLVGCAGEDFQSILNALGYRSETIVRKIAPAEPVTTEPETPAEASVPDTVVEQVAEAAQLATEVPANAESEGEAPVAAQAEISAPETTKPTTEEVTVWRPKSQPSRNRPQRQSKDKKSEGEEHTSPPDRQHTRRKPQSGERQKFRGKGKKRPQDDKQNTRPQKRAADPDSPFAALAALKEKMKTGD